jgi:Fe-S cluster assembly protein SufD
VSAATGAGGTAAGTTLAPSTTLAAGTTLALPTTEEELWRYSRIGELRLEDFAPAAHGTVVASGAEWVSHRVPAAPASAPEDALEALGAAADVEVVVSTRRGEVVAEPIVLEHRVEGSGLLVRPRLVVEAGEDSEITILERFSSPDDARSLAIPRVEIRAAAAARVTYVALNEWGRATWQVASQWAEGDRDAALRLATVALGGDYARVRAVVRLVGRGASARQVALYFADGTQMHDFRTMQDHAAPRTHSDLLFKGAVAGTSRSVYTGLIKIRDDAEKSEAFQTNRTLTLSRGAWAESVPNLEIETNDVKCSHASAVGPIDAEQRYYLESRGIPPEVAERLVVLGFFRDVLDGLPSHPLVAAALMSVRAKVGAGATDVGGPVRAGAAAGGGPS